MTFVSKNLPIAAKALDVDPCELRAALKLAGLHAVKLPKQKITINKIRHCNRCGDNAVVGSGRHNICDKCSLVIENDIAALREAGYTYQAIGDTYGLSRERVRQILNEISPCLTGYRRAIGLPFMDN